ncbi:MAG: hypothetical protein A3C85_03015 [Candidatus Doudnabacteria bacterium RIFCSPHIGHO2_02_FULL_48_21]|uniref:Blue (type 1) copper domain-containing protein n=1 Tax=Candidatus Doudnabacteria bacterium RIFCSPLOWO2_02_FULL_48_13 TaxID=1817845 RepID=A0A1F5QC33_9BACT|nr:MAG: hypothetical protein A3K05_00275 [Candidatus Doudnabacteria bacterium RIFCSPHIGHO2_01_48_18]OGE77078.1 MAG: hypothetical protein A2668_02385 [Candidatus Doudnabacteria bacterium RIFCSPHIGHO2_01_FULL_48_180]OGE91619.1 MAG: hypothetical protein A3F44_02845 [Candidatus Doudnabacteria bacterium RIFCSPHIGHO2_12_FULL_47_25]OGE93233.1 MAG: hypothetical protein A3C85_03015 [Candidatus Doudnabacteria bacterium RIFCSPHIGHO2_02_FULL_48_21]OGE96356.1 MAG: hypothetical protein A3A83_01260 [Candidatu
MTKQHKFFLLLPLVIAAGIAGYFFLFRAKANTVTISDSAPWFFPTVLEIAPNTTVTWQLKAAAVHPVMTLEGPEEIHSGHFTRDFSHTFTKPGVYVYICPIHPYMRGVIGVGAKVPPEKIPKWASWPPPPSQIPGELPPVKGAGHIWVEAQFQESETKSKPGSILIINADSWQIDEIITDESLNNPHNLWEIGGKIIVTNWFDKYLSVFDKFSRQLVDHVLVGESPAHVMGTGDKIYVTVQGEDALAILDDEYEILKKVRAPKGPHGHWMSEDGRIMAVASTEKGKISVWDTESDTILFEEFLDDESAVSHEDMHIDEEHNHSLPLMAGITDDGRFAFAAGNGDGKFYVFDVPGKKFVKAFDIGSGPVQTVPSPDGRFVLVPLSGSGEVAVVSTKNWTIVKKIANVGAGAHGVAYGKRQDGKWYAYVSNKFAAWITVIDMETLDIAGYIPLPPDAWGGQGILVTN